LAGREDAGRNAEQGGRPAGRTVAREVVARAPDGSPVEGWTLRAGALEARVLGWGATLASLRAPDASGRMGELVLGFDDARDWLGDHPHVGCTVGRLANRVGGARFELEGREVRLTPNLGRHHLHGGPRGLHRVVWSGEPDPEPAGPGAGVTLAVESPHGDEGYPGRLRVRARFQLLAAEELAPGERAAARAQGARPVGALRFAWEAEADRPTVAGLAQHAYFDLSGRGGGAPATDHSLEVAAARVTRTDADAIPTGELEPVEGTALDLRRPRLLGEVLEALAPRPGLDDNYVLDAPGRGAVAACLHHPSSGRLLAVQTTLPGLQVYTANHLDGRLRGRGDTPWCRWGAVCLEAQYWPDAVHHPHFPQPLVRPDHPLSHQTSFLLATTTPPPQGGRC